MADDSMTFRDGEPAVNGHAPGILNPLWKRFSIAVWRIAFVVVIFLWLHPVTYRSTRMAIVGLVALLWGSSLVLWWDMKAIRIAALAIAVVVLLLAILPGRTPDVGKLRSNYVKSLTAYEGTRYIWGGENRLGIDCSGLVRRGLIDASLRQGLTTANPGLIRRSFLMRWFDCSARALQEEYRSQTHRLFPARSIQQLDHTKLEPGDFAVTASGVHTLAYLGDKKWIEADPGAGRVITVRAEDDNGWLKVPIEVVRWRAFETESYR